MNKSTHYLFLFIVTASLLKHHGYYNNATGSGYTLKTQLYNIIKDHTVQDYAGLYVTRNFRYDNSMRMTVLF
jgi:hypothetical protein